MAIKFPVKHILSALALATLGLASGSVLAQSTEYRRGYDQGYRDGIEATTAQGQPPATTGRINVLSATYGVRGANCDVRDAIQQVASRRRYAGITAGNTLCGDPAPNRAKRLTITYQCGEGPEQRASGPEGSVVAMNCR